MIVVCVSSSKAATSKQVDTVQITLHQTDYEAHAIGEAYQAFTTIHTRSGPPSVKAHVIPAELVILEYAELRKAEGFAEVEAQVLNGNIDPLEDVEDWEIFGFGNPGNPTIDPEALSRLREFFMRNPPPAMG